MHYKEYVRTTGISVFFIFATFLLNPVLAPYVKSLGFDDFQIGLMFSVLPLITIIASPILGRLADNIGKLRVIIFGIILEITAIIFYLSASNWFFVVIARILDAVAMIAVTVIVIARIEDSLPDKNRGKYGGLSLSFGHIGKIVAPVLGGFLADTLFLKAPFLLAAIMLLILGFLLSARNTKVKKHLEKNDFNVLESLKFFLSEKKLRGMAILGFVMHASIPATSVFLPIFIIEKLGLSYTYVGIAIFFFGVTHLFQFYFGHLSDIFGRLKSNIFGTVFFGVFLFLLGYCNNYFLVLIVLFFMGVGGAIWNVSAWSLMSDVGEKLKKESQVVCSYVSFAKIGHFISFLISGLIVQVYGFKYLFFSSGLLIVVGSFFAIRFLKD